MRHLLSRYPTMSRRTLHRCRRDRDVQRADDRSTITGATFIVMHGSTPIAGSVMLDAETATFTPNDPLANDTIYTASISAGATDEAGNALAGGDAIWMFQTADTIRPTVLDTDPISGATQVDSGAPVIAMFSESMDDSTVTD